MVDICGETVQLLLVADGHGGEEVAELCAQHAFDYLVKEATDTGDGSAASLEKALIGTFERLHTSARALSQEAGTQGVENVASPFWHGPASSPHGSKGRAAPTHSRFRIPGATYPAGATLTIAAWNASRGEVTIANVGDSAGLLVEAAGSRLLTEEHRLSDSAAERERVLASGSQLGRAMSSVTGLPGERPGAHAFEI